MKISKILKFAGLAAIVVTMTVGCASTQNEPASEPAAHKSGPSEAESAIAAAKAAVKKAASVGGEWRDSGKIIKQAEEALKKGDEAGAIKLANKARRQGELGYAQALAEQERLNKQSATYTVVKGDSLWKISGKDDIYGNPYQWPLLYKANRDIIKDADLIYPGQDLSVDHSATSADIDAAIRHAKTRGAWAVGVVEESDKAYLAK